MPKFEVLLRIAYEVDAVNGKVAKKIIADTKIEKILVNAGELNGMPISAKPATVTRIN